MSSSINIALPAISKEFKMSSILISWIPTIFLLSSAIFLIPFGKIADCYDKRKIFLLGITIYTVASFLSCLSFYLVFFLIIRFLYGLGVTMIFSTVIALLSSFFLLGERGRALGINVSVTYLRLSSGSFLGGIGFILLLVSIFLLHLFIFRQSKTIEPILDIKLFKNNPTFTFSNLAAMVNYSVTFGISFLLSLYFQYLRNFDSKRQV